MATKRSSRVVLNRRAVDGVRLAVADGIFEVGKAIIVQSDPPDAEPFGEGLTTRGGTLTYVDDKKVAGWGEDGRQPKKPRAVRVRGWRGILGIVGWGFPGRFQQWGTVHHAAQPFAWQAIDPIIPRIPSIVRQAAAYRLARLRRLGRA